PATSGSRSGTLSRRDHAPPPESCPDNRARRSLWRRDPLAGSAAAAFSARRTPHIYSRNPAGVCNSESSDRPCFQAGRPGRFLAAYPLSSTRWLSAVGGTELAAPLAPGSLGGLYSAGDNGVPDCQCVPAPAGLSGASISRLSPGGPALL